MGVVVAALVVEVVVVVVVLVVLDVSINKDLPGFVLLVVEA